MPVGQRRADRGATPQRRRSRAAQAFEACTGRPARARMEEEQPLPVGGLAAERDHGGAERRRHRPLPDQTQAGQLADDDAKPARPAGRPRPCVACPGTRTAAEPSPLRARTRASVRDRRARAASQARTGPRRAARSGRDRSAAAAAGPRRGDRPGSPASTASSSTGRLVARGRDRSVRRSVVSSPQAAPFDADSTSTVVPIAPLTRRSTRKVKTARPSPRSRRSTRRPTNAPSVWARRLRGSGIAHEHACAGVAVAATTATAATHAGEKEPHARHTPPVSPGVTSVDPLRPGSAEPRRSRWRARSRASRTPRSPLRCPRGR